jgi:pimeloyl-ACP methyl ester carboxylesterase
MRPAVNQDASVRTHRVLSLSAHGFHRVAYREWGDAANTSVVVCVHGLTRNARDFDALAAALCGDFRVLCPDLPGRGDSEWLQDPNDYIVPTYCTTITALLAQAGVDELSWVGTSLGGILGMILAAQPGTPIRRLVVNDVGPVLERAALTRIGGYVGLMPTFASFAALEAYIRQISAPFGTLTDPQWTALSRSTAREMPDGTWRLNYDPGIAVPFANAPVADLWQLWDRIACPTLVLRGSESDLLSVETATAMRARGPRAQVIEVPGVGHAPMLLDDAQIGPVATFLAQARRDAPPA